MTSYFEKENKSDNKRLKKEIFHFGRFDGMIIFNNTQTTPSQKERN